MRFPPSLLDEIRARLPVSQVVGRKVKLKRQGREYAGLSPFKVEKSPSFFVNDQKGFYHCFSSGEHGDIFTFLIKTEGLSFPEAVERLAQEAGVALPKPTERDERREDERQRLTNLVEAAAKIYEAALYRPEGREALRYIEGRGLTRETLKRFRIGYASAGRAALKEELARQGFTQEEMAKSGMLIAGEDIPVSYDRFRNRLMFPITDLRDRVIAFGGRALEKDAKPKYLNSPETPLFHKGGRLFNAAKARSAAHEKGEIIVVEGYMDAIALAAAGFQEAVAPLGTALTETQLGLLWRICPEPTLCFDGDAAGQKAAFRAIDTALPLLKPGQSLKFAFLPDGLDPDDLIRQQGPDALSEALKGCRPLVDMLWERERTQGDWSTPERRARFEQQIKSLIARIGDGTVRSHYEQHMRERLRRELGGGGNFDRQRAQQGNGRPGGQRGNKWDNKWGGRSPHQQGGRGRDFGRFGGFPGMPLPPSSSLKQSPIVKGTRIEPSRREVLVLRTLINHPWLIEEQAEAIAELPFESRGLSGLRDALLQAHALKSPLDSEELRTQLNLLGHDGVLALVDRSITHRGDKFAEPDAPRNEVEVGWQHLLGVHRRQMDLTRQLSSAEAEWFADAGEESFARLCDLNGRLNAAEGRELEPGD